MRRNQDLPRGRVERLEIESEALRGNLQGDPNRRELHVYLPPGRADGAAYVVPFTKEQLKAAPADTIGELTKNDGMNIRDRAYEYYQAERYWN